MKKIVVCLVLAAIAALTWTFAPPFLDAPIDADARPSTIDTGALTSVADPELAVPDERAGGARSVGSSAPEVATAEAAAPTGSGQLRVVVTWPEGDPAPGVGLLIHTGSRPGYDVRNGTLVETDASGVAVVDDLSPGPVEVRAFRSAEERLARGEISSGATTELACVLSESIRVTGVVEDTNGSPVAHADVWLTSRAPGILGGRIVGRADSDGRFELRHVPRTQSIGAIAEGFAPSELTDLDLVDLSESPVALRLVLAPDGAALRGVVLDEAGDPVADARVAVRSPFPETRSMHPNGSMSERWTPRTGETDGAGRFSFAGLYPGTTRVEVLAEGRPLWLDEVDLERGATVEIVVPLEVGAVVRGVLRDAEGDPVADGRVVAYRDAIEERFLPVGQLPGNGASFGRDMAWTDASGAFVLEGLAPGEAHLYAQPPRDPGRRMGEVVLWDSTILTLSPGDDVVWDARLGAGLSITGRVGYADGTPMPGVFVSARDSESDKEFATFTEDGTFEFVRLSAVPHEVRVQLQDPPPNSAPLVVDGVMPGGAPIELLADFGPPGSTEPARISVVFDDGADRAGDVRAILSLEFVDGVSWERGTPDGDRWSFEQPYPGRCRVVAFAGERLIAATDVFEVDHGDDIDLGTLATKPGGSLSITVDRAEGTDLYELHGLLKHAGSFRWHAFAPGRSSSIRLDGLEPGEHQLRLMSQRGVRIHRAITIEPGRETSLSVELVEGVEVPYEITWDADDPPERLRYSARTAAGEVFLDRTWGDLGPSEGKIEHRVFAPIGVHTFEATADDGRRAETTFQVGADGAAGPVETIRVEL